MHLRDGRMPPRQVGARLARVLARAAAAGPERGRAAPPELRRRGGRAPGRPGLHADGLGLAGAAVVPVATRAEIGRLSRPSSEATRRPPRHRADAVTETTSRRWRGPSTPSSRRGHGNSVPNSVPAQVGCLRRDGPALGPRWRGPTGPHLAAPAPPRRRRGADAVADSVHSLPSARPAPGSAAACGGCGRRRQCAADPRCSRASRPSPTARTTGPAALARGLASIAGARGPRSVSMPLPRDNSVAAYPKLAYEPRQATDIARAEFRRVAAEHGASRDRRLAENAEARAAEAAEEAAKKLLADQEAAARAEEAALARQQAEDGAAQCINQTVATHLRHGSIMTSTPPTRRQLDGAALWSLAARFSQHGDRLPAVDLCTGAARRAQAITAERARARRRPRAIAPRPPRRAPRPPRRRKKRRARVPSPPVWKSTSASGLRGRPGSVERRGTGITTPSSGVSRRCVEDDAMIQHERAVKF